MIQRMLILFSQFFQEFDDKTDVMADKAVDSLKKSATSFWSAASGYATQMFVQDDLESEALLIQDKGKLSQMDLTSLNKLRVLNERLVNEVGKADIHLWFSYNRFN